MRTVSRHWENRVRVVLAWLLAVGLFVSNAAHSAPGTAYTVTSAADDAVGVSCAATPSQCNTLRDAVFSASSGGDSINFSALFNSPQTITLTGGEMLISHSVVITGPGANLLAISGNQVSRIFRVASGTVLTLGGATLRDGLAGDVGGAIVSDGGLNLSFCVVTGNKAPGSFTGGGVYQAGGSATIFGCTFDNNSAGTGAGLEVINATATITNSTFSGNVASSNGGAIGFHPFTAIQTLTVRNTTIAYNRSPGAGGIFVDSSSTTVTAAATQINNTLFGNNVGASLATGGVNSATVTSGGFNLASDGGGGFLVGPHDQLNVDPHLGPLSLNGANTPTHALLGGSPALDTGKNSGPPPLDQRTAPRPFVTGAIPLPSGGDGSDIGAVEMQAIFVSAGAGPLDAAIATANSNGKSLNDIIFVFPSFEGSQTIDLEAALPDITSNVTINGPGANLLTVQRDYQSATEFGIFNVPGSGLNVAINGMTISNGSRATGGGIQSNSNLSLAGVNVTGNRASSGGGVFLSLSNGVFTDSTFSDNTAQAVGGICFEGGDGHALRLSNSTVSGNVETADCRGAGISHVGASGPSTLQVVSSTIARNVPLGSCPGGIGTVAAGGTPTTTLRNSIVGNNAGSDLGKFGGTATVISLGFNLASDSGGGFLTAASDQVNTDPKLGPLSLNGAKTPTHALLGGSHALDKGNSSGRTTDQRGAVRAFDIPTIVASSGGDNADIGAVEMQAIIVSNTLADGTFNCNGVSCTLRQAINTANTSTSTFNDIIFASSLFSTPQTIDLTSALPDISSNVTVNGPGADLLTVTRDAAAPNFPIFRVPGFLRNVAINGITISNGNNNNGNENGGGVESNSSLAMANVYVTGNNALNSGGGVALNAGNGTFTNSTFTNNTSGNYGGGLFFGGNPNLELGGNSTLDLRGCTVSGNSSVHGGGIAVLMKLAGISATLNVVNSTIVDNAPGGIETNSVDGLFTAATALLRNSIIAVNATNNLVQSGPGGFFSRGFNLSNSFDGITTNGGDILALPRLAPLNYYGGPTPTHALLDGSPALDAGNSSGAVTDQRGFGFLRPVDLQVLGSPPGDAADIGAWEAQARDLLFINGFESD